WMLVSLGLYVAALLCKAVAVTLPAILLILDVYPLRRLGGHPGRWFGPAERKVWLEKIPFALVSFAFMVVAVIAQSRSQTLITYAEYGPSQRLAQACYGVWFYLQKTLVPLDLIAYYPLPRGMDGLAPSYLLCVAGVVAVTVGAVVLRRWPGLLAGWLSYIV